MELNTKQWHVKFFFWCLTIWDAFSMSHTSRKQTNLCHYVRTIFVWMPLSLTCQVGLVAYAGYVLIWYPVDHFGWTVYGYFWVSLAATVAAIVVVVFAVNFIGYLISQLMKRRMRKEVVNEEDLEEPTHELKPQEPPKPGFVEVIFAWLVAQKQRICPTIVLTDSSTQTKEAA